MPLLNESANYIIVCEKWSSILSCTCVFKGNCSDFQNVVLKNKQETEEESRYQHHPCTHVFCYFVCDVIQKKNSIQIIP